MVSQTPPPCKARLRRVRPPVPSVSCEGHSTSAAGCTGDARARLDMPGAGAQCPRQTQPLVAARRHLDPLRRPRQVEDKEAAMAIALSHGGPAIYRSPERSRHVLIGTTRGVARLERDPDGPGWHLAHRAPPGQHTHALLEEPAGSTVLAGANAASRLDSAARG